MTFCDSAQYLCDICDIIFRDANKILKHNIHDHGLTKNEVTFDCAICFQSFTEKFSFAQHIQKTEQKGKYYALEQKIEINKEKLENKNDDQRISKRDQDISLEATKKVAQEAAKVAVKEFAQNYAVEVAIAAAKAAIKEASKAKKKVKKKSSNHDGDDRKKSDHFVISNEYSTNYFHQNEIESEVENQYDAKEDYFPGGEITQQQLKNNIHNIHRNRNYKCDICSKIFSHVDSFKDHILNNHINKYNQYNADSCDKSFATENSGSWFVEFDTIRELNTKIATSNIKIDDKSVNENINDSESDNDNVNEIVNKNDNGIITQSQLKSKDDSVVIKNDSNKICPICQKSFESSFKSAFNLQRHIENVHEGEKDHQCHLCEKVFFNMSFQKHSKS